MTPEQKVAFIMAQVACAQAETLAMFTDNQMAGPLNYKYRYKDFMAVQEKYVIGHNAVISYFMD